jgi:hypothetical protein
VPDKIVDSCTRLIVELDEVINEKTDNENRWSKVSTTAIVAITVTLTVGTIIATLVVDLRAIPAGLAALTGIVATASNILPYEKKRLGNKILLAKAKDVRERVEDLRDGISLASASIDERYERLAQLRFEKHVICATSSAQAALRPFREVLENS